MIKQGMNLQKKKLNIVYLCIAEKGPSGGGKIIYNHSEIINYLKAGFTSEVIHIKKKKSKKWIGSINKILNINEKKFFGWNVKDITIKKNYKSEWFKNNIRVRNDFNFDNSKDFVIVPEIFAHFSTELFFKRNIPYAIFVQNGYSLHSTNDYKLLNKAYKNAKFILSYSKNITDCVTTAFPFCKKKILNTKYSIDKSKFNLTTRKQNLITYMPRKLRDHSEHLLFFLKNNLPKTWKIKPIHNMTEKNVFKILCKSKLFLSFSKLEGLALPPIEAAIAGNKVIGYTGEGGKEHWKKPLFTEIHNGDFIKFISEILNYIKNKKINTKFKSLRKKIIKDFSVKNEEKHILIMLNKIRSLF